MHTQTLQQIRNYFKAYAVNATAVAFSATNAWANSPFDANNGVPWTGQSGGTPPLFEITPYGTGVAGGTFDVQVDRIDLIQVPGALPNTFTQLYVARPALRFTATLGAGTGIAGTPVLNTELFCDTVSAPAAGFGTDGVDCFKLSPGNGYAGGYLVDVRGANLLRVQVKLGTATAANCLLRGIG